MVWAGDARSGPMGWRSPPPAPSFFTTAKGEGSEDGWASWDPTAGERGLQGQNSFYNNTKMLLVFFALIFSRVYRGFYQSGMFPGRRLSRQAECRSRCENPPVLQEARHSRDLQVSNNATHPIKYFLKMCFSLKMLFVFMCLLLSFLNELFLIFLLEFLIR